ncbi:metalloreductase STEAP4-like isoform X2 [Babylonia areolata]
MAASEELLHPMMKRGLAEKKRVGILGTGDFARALSKRLISSGYDVVLGSRAPAARRLSSFDECLCGVRVTTLDDCIKQCEVLVAAIHMENFRATLAPRADLLAGKVVVDISNRTNRYSAVSNAEFLQAMLPEAMVVKAFNSVSAYTLEDHAAVGTSRVFVCSDDPGARERVMDLARGLGFAPSDMGALRSARSMEAFVLKVFPGWKVPLFFTFGVFNLWALYCVYIYFIERTAYRWDQIFLKVLNKPLCMTAVTVLALTYLPGSVAGVVQLHRGTKYRRFPAWLGAWMASRRQLGLIALALALMHALASAMMLSPTYYSSWFQRPAVILPANITAQTLVQLQPAWMVWKGELACLLGLMSLLLLSLVGLASLPSVSAALNWAEWRLLQSRVGVLALLLAAGHVAAMGAPGWAKGGWAKTFRSITFLSGFLPAVTLLLRLVLALPPLSHRLKKIRHGWERKDAVAAAENGAGGGDFQSASMLTNLDSSCCSSSSRKGILKKSSCMSASGSDVGLKLSSQNTAVYTALRMDGGEGGEEGENGGCGGACGSCQSEGARPSSMPTRGCDCSVV